MFLHFRVSKGCIKSDFEVHDRSDKVINTSIDFKIRLFKT